LYGKAEATIAAFERLEALSGLKGLVFNRGKCKILRNTRNAEVDGRLSMHGTSDGIMALGVPIGTPSFVERGARKIFSDYGNGLEWLGELPPGMLFPLYAACFNSKPTFLLRSIDPDIIRQFACAWDNRADEILAKASRAILGEGGYDEWSAQVRGLTTSRGGLGIPRLHLLSRPAYTASFWRACWYMKRHLPHIWENCLHREEANKARDKIQDLLEYIEPPRNLVVRPDFYFEDELSVSRQSTLTNVVQDAVLAHMIGSRDLSKPRKAMLLSAGSNGTAAFMYAETQSNRALAVPTDAYVDAIRLRLLLPASESDPGFRQSCPCDIGDKEDMDQHGFLCNATSGARKIRHDRIVEALARFIKWCNPDAQVEKEVWVSTNTKADIRVTQNGTVFWIDVSIVAPNGVKYIALGSHTTGLVAAKHREEKKREHYAPAMRGSVGGSVTLVPFVMEITGALGPAAKAYIDMLTKIETAIPEANEDMARKRRYFKKLVSAYLVIGNEHCLRVSRKKLKAVRAQQTLDNEDDDEAEPPDPQAPVPPHPPEGDQQEQEEADNDDNDEIISKGDMAETTIIGVDDGASTSLILGQDGDNAAESSG
jgi:hypothetical protein